MAYDYRKALVEDIKKYIEDNYWLEEHQDSDNLAEDLCDEIWDNDDITGNGYHWYDTEDKCAEYVSQNMDLLYEAVENFGIGEEANQMIDHWKSKDLARYFDCTIRCYLLMECVCAAVEKLIQEGKLKNLTNN